MEQKQELYNLHELAGIIMNTEFIPNFYEARENEQTLELINLEEYMKTRTMISLKNSIIECSKDIYCMSSGEQGLQKY